MYILTYQNPVPVESDHKHPPAGSSEHSAVFGEGRLLVSVRNQTRVVHIPVSSNRTRKKVRADTLVFTTFPPREAAAVGAHVRAPRPTAGASLVQSACRDLGPESARSQDGSGLWARPGSTPEVVKCYFSYSPST